MRGRTRGRGHALRRVLSITFVVAASSRPRSSPERREATRQSTPTYKIVFDNAFGLVEGGDFRVGGVKAGKTTKFEVAEAQGRPARAS